MKNIMEVLAAIIARNAKEGAGAASYHGMYETEVPEALKKA